MARPVHERGSGSTPITQRSGLELWLRRIGWLVLLWAAGVASVAALAWLMRELMKWAGMA
jgi:Protein of unknown function (DUF2474)